MNNEISLRPWRMSDAPKLAETINDPLVMRYLTITMPNPYGLADAEDYLNKTQEIRHADRAILYNGEVVGCMGATHRPEQNDCFLGYWLGSAWHGKNIATRALQQYLQLLPSLFPGVPTITATLFEPNIASQRLLLKFGFTYTGIEENAPQAWDGNFYKGLVFQKPMGT